MMVTSIARLPSEVTYLTPTGPMEIRMSEHNPRAILAAAQALKAKRYVSVSDYDHDRRMPIWGVFETGQREPIKTFTSDSSAPAVMYAHMHRGELMATLADQRAKERALASKYPIAIIAAGRPVRYRKTNTAPGDGTLVKWGVNLKAGFVARYYPSKKGWLLIDVRNAQFFRYSNGFSKWVGYVRSDKPLPSMEAAIMVAIHKLAGHSSTV